MPHGDSKLSDISQLYTKPRSWLLSFVGSTHRPSEPSMPLSFERYPILKRLMEAELRYEKEGVAAFTSERLQDNIQGLHKVAGLRSREALFVAPMSTFPASTGINDAMRYTTNTTKLERVKYTRERGSSNHREWTPLLHDSTLLLHASSIFSLQLPGDGPHRFDSLHIHELSRFTVKLGCLKLRASKWGPFLSL
eukprot:m.118593 g.118593  ORF g.118593 m.118593 type:complete len:194 (-) comp15569_c0_seq6:546-1127(-)